MEELTEKELWWLLRDHEIYRNLALSSYSHLPYFTFRTHHISIVVAMEAKILILKNAISLQENGQKITKLDLLPIFE